MAKIIDIQNIGTGERNEVLENILRLICKNSEDKLDEVIIYDSTKLKELFSEMTDENKNPLKLDKRSREALNAVFSNGRIGKGEDAGFRRRILYKVKRTINKTGQRCVYSPSILSQEAIGEERDEIYKIFEQIGEQFSKKRKLKPEDVEVLMGKLKELKPITDKIDIREKENEETLQAQREENQALDATLKEMGLKLLEIVSMKRYLGISSIEDLEQIKKDGVPIEGLNMIGERVTKKTREGIEAFLKKNNIEIISDREGQGKDR